MPFTEALGQFSCGVGPGNLCPIHVSLVPVLSFVGEQKTKPTKHCVREIRGLRLTPNIITCRSSQIVEESAKEELSLFSHVKDEEEEKEEEKVEEVPIKRIRVKLRSHFAAFVEEACKSVIEAGRRTNARISGPVFLPRRNRSYCLPKSPHAHKDAMEHYVVHTYSRLVDIHNPSAETLDALMELDFPPAVKIQVIL